MEAAHGWKLHGAAALRRWLLAHRNVTSGTQMHGSCRNGLLEKAGMRIAWDEAVWCSSALDSVEATLVVDDTVITRRTRAQGFKALGSWITFDGHFVKELVEREVIAWRTVYAIRKLLCDCKVALRHRLRLLSLCVTSSLYWCSCSWILTQS